MKKTEYEITTYLSFDWSSDLFSSDLIRNNVRN